MAVLLTTSRRPVRRIRTFCRDLVRSIPNVFYINRGKLNLDGIAEKALESNANRVVIVSRYKGGPGKIQLFQTSTNKGLTQIPPVLYVAGLRLQREFKIKSRNIQSLMITIQTKVSQQILKLAESLSIFLRISISSPRRITSTHVSSNYQASMHFSSDSSHFSQITFLLFPKTVEVGPRIIISHIAWEIKK